jgi:RimJ/RimL family protein N-acetyltransferase
LDKRFLIILDRIDYDREVQNMASVVDPTEALVSFQKELRREAIVLQRCELDRELFVHLDYPHGSEKAPRFTYARIKHNKVVALVMLFPVEPLEGTMCFQIGVAVPEKYRGHGRAKDAMSAALREFRHGWAKCNAPDYYLEALVDCENVASQHVAAATISATPKMITDKGTGRKGLQYIQKVLVPRSKTA